MLDASGFKGLLHSCFMSPQRCAEYLGVSLRTVQHWLAGTRRVPWSVVRLLRLQRQGELGALYDRWEGWCIRDDAIYSPENRPFRFELMHAFFCVVERARLWQLDYDRRNRARQDGEARGCGGEAPADTLLIPEPAEVIADTRPAALPAISASAAPTPNLIFVLPVGAANLTPEQAAMAAALPATESANVLQLDQDMLRGLLALAGRTAIGVER